MKRALRAFWEQDLRGWLCDLPGCVAGLALLAFALWLIWALSDFLPTHRALGYCVWLGLPVAGVAYSCSGYARTVPSVRARDIQIAAIAAAIVLSVGAARDQAHLEELVVLVVAYLPGRYSWDILSGVWWGQVLLAVFWLAWVAVLILIPAFVGVTAEQVYKEARLRERDAMADFKRVIWPEPGYAEAHASLAVVYLALGDRGAALEEYRILKDLDADGAGELFKLLYP